jgi:hypothetical protein
MKGVTMDNDEMTQWLRENTDDGVHETIIAFRKENTDQIATLMSRMIMDITLGDLVQFNDVLLIYGTLVATHAVKNLSQD